MAETHQVHEIEEDYCAQLGQLANKLKGFLFLGKHVEALQHVAAGAVQPFNVAVFGRMKTGKSSLINAMIGRPLAITGAEETTATINCLSYGDGEQLNSFKVHWKDDQPESFPLEQLQSGWNGKDPDVLKRIQRTSFLELFSNVPRLKDIHIVDTPGTGSTAVEHEKVAQQFIAGQETDALVYVFSSVGGREMDEEALSEFRKTCLPGSDPYNSVAVLHKWDETYWKNGGDMDDILAKASRLRERMKDTVADVLPVSAPLALLVKMASPGFWEQCLAVACTYAGEAELKRSLLNEALWNKKDEQKELWTSAKQEYALPWASFRIMFREIFRKKPVNVAEARAIICELSGIEAFEVMLEERFFKQQAVIRLRQTRARAQSVIDQAYIDINSELTSRKEQLEKMRCIEKEVQTPELKSWLDNEIGKRGDEQQSLETSYLEIDEDRIKLEQKFDQKDDKIEVVRWLDSQEAAPLADVRDLIMEALKNSHLPEDGELRAQLRRRVAELRSSPDSSVREKAEKLNHLLINLS